MAAGPAACRTEIRVRYAEVDQMGVLHHSRYWVYFEAGRTELLRQQGMTYAEMERNGIYLVVARCAAKFLAPAHYDELLVLTTRVARVGRARIDHAYQLHRKADHALLCTAETTLACVNAQRRIIPLPQQLRIPSAREDPADGRPAGRDPI